MPQQPAQDELRRQLAALERFLADPAAAGLAEALLAPMRQQADTVRQLLTGRGVQAGRDVRVGGDLVLGDQIGRQVNTGGGAYVAGDVRTGDGDFVGRDRS